MNNNNDNNKTLGISISIDLGITSEQQVSKINKRIDKAKVNKILVLLLAYYLLLLQKQ